MLVDIDPNGNAVTRNIEDIRVGDVVLTKDQFDPDAPLTRQVVTDTFQTTAYRTWTVQIRDDETGELETVTTTDEHPFYVEGHGWTAAQDLTEGATLTNPDGTTATVVSLETTLHGEGLTVYNFAVDTTHTYFVADAQGDVNAVWVHNNYVLESYSKGGGHHIYAKAAFRGIKKYRKGLALCISKKIMKKLKINHKVVTKWQRKLFRKLGRSGKANILKEHTKIAVEALVKGGAPLKTARSIVAQGLRDLRRMGVRSPSRIPWYS